MKAGLLLVALLAGSAGAQDAGREGSQGAAPGRAKAQPCAVCHGPLGLSVTPDAPNLAGQPALYIAAQLRAYRGGARRHEVMTLMARSLSDDDIGALAAWYSSIKVEANAP